VAAVQHLVAAAVAGLSPDRVAIVDDKGNLLAGGDDKNGPDAAAASQDQQTTDFEDRMRQRIESIVASVVGEGHVRVQVTAQVAYNHSSETSELFDPDSKVVRSTQTVEQNASDSTPNSSGAVSVTTALPNQQPTPSGSDTQKSESGRTEETTNYEISKTVKTSTIDGGDVKRMSVAVVVDGNTSIDAAGHMSYTPRTAQEMAQIDGLVRSAIGFDKSRGDQVQVVNMAFAKIDGGQGTPAPQPFLGLDGSYWFKIIEAAILSITALIIGLFVLRPLIARMFGPLSLSVATPGPLQLPAPAAEGEAAQVDGQPLAIAGPDEAKIDIARIDGQVRESAIRKVGEVVQSHPEEALAILRTWLHQPG
jgi:flagellar M-ring protein FliF